MTYWHMWALPGTPVGGLFPPRLPSAIGEGQPEGYLRTSKLGCAVNLGMWGGILLLCVKTWKFTYLNVRPVTMQLVSYIAQLPPWLWWGSFVWINHSIILRHRRGPLPHVQPIMETRYLFMIDCTWGSESWWWYKIGHTCNSVRRQDSLFNAIWCT